jgi:hypothetical protein
MKVKPFYYLRVEIEYFISWRDKYWSKALSKVYYMNWDDQRLNYRATISGQVALTPLNISPNEFIYVDEKDSRFIKAYNHKQLKSTLPFGHNEKHYINNDTDSKVTAYTLFQTDLISNDSEFQIRLWDLSSRSCKRILNSFLTC